MRVRVGTAGWAIPRALADRFPAEGAGLARYAARLDALELNSPFWRRHRASTWQRWADTVPPGFRFSVKIPRAITHEGRLQHARPLLEELLADVAPLGDKLGPLLVQLPPKLGLDVRTARAFFALLRKLHDGPVVCEPRHADWFTPRAEELFTQLGISRVGADPVRVPGADVPFGPLAYFRLHGSPTVYRSPYGSERLQSLRSRLRDGAWVIFDNTASGAAAGDALLLRSLLDERPHP